MSADPSSSLSGHYRKRDFLARLGVLHLAQVEYVIEEKQLSASPFPLPPGVILGTAFANLWARPDRFYYHTRVTQSEFLTLLAELGPTISLGHAESSSHKIYVHQRLSTAEQLLLWMYFSDGTDDDVLGLLFRNMDRRSVSRIADLITAVINSVYDEELAWPDAAERSYIHGLFAVNKTAIALLDGSHCEIEIPSRNESLFYNSHKKRHTLNYMVIVNALGYYIHVSKGIEGRRNDRGIFNDMDLTRIPLSPGELIIADGGFQGEGPLIYPYASTTINAAGVTAEQKIAAELLNHAITLDRSQVEHAVHTLKNRAQALATRFSRHHRNLDDLVWAAARLCNRIRSMRLDAVQP